MPLLSRNQQDALTAAHKILGEHFDHHLITVEGAENQVRNIQWKGTVSTMLGMSKSAYSYFQRLDLLVSPDPHQLIQKEPNAPQS